MLSRISYYLSMLTSNPLDFVIFLLYELLVIAISFSLHEYAHARAAFLCGDPTAKYLGRMTLDPRSHLTIAGTVCLFLLGFGWGKPVPVDARNFKHRRRWLDDLCVSLAGITANFAVFLVCVILSIAVNRFLWNGDAIRNLPAAYGVEWMTNPYAGGFGTAIAYDGITETVRELAAFSRAPWLLYVQHFFLLMAMTNLMLAIFNSLPIPPLDGYHLFNDLLFRGRFRLSPQMADIVQYALLALLLVGALSGILTTVNRAVYTGVLRFLLLITGQA